MTIGISVISLFIIWGTQLMLRSPYFYSRFRSLDVEKAVRNIWIISGLAIFSRLAWHAFFLYSSWRADPLAQYYLPPHQPWTYFAWTEFAEVWSPWVISLVAGMLAKRTADILNRRYGYRFFEKEEPLLFGVAVFLTGYPGCLFYTIFLGMGALVWTGICHLRGKSRASLYFLWLPLALFAILITYTVIPPEMIFKFKL